MEYRVNEIFSSIEGEGKRVGKLVTFIRLHGCNLKCSYCDTRYSCEGTEYEKMNTNEILRRVEQLGNKRITLTGGEPLLAENVEELINCLVSYGCEVNIETNGSIDLTKLNPLKLNKIIYTMDYKCPSSGMEQNMCIDNIRFLQKKDAIKFVVGDREDLERAYDVIRLSDCRATVYLSPVFGKIEPVQIVEFMKEKDWQRASIQLQIHKFIWNPQERGV